MLWEPGAPARLGPPRRGAHHAVLIVIYLHTNEQIKNTQ